MRRGIFRSRELAPDPLRKARAQPAGGTACGAQLTIDNRSTSLLFQRGARAGGAAGRVHSFTFGEYLIRSMRSVAYLLIVERFVSFACDCEFNLKSLTVLRVLILTNLDKLSARFF